MCESCILYIHLRMDYVRLYRITMNGTIFRFYNQTSEAGTLGTSFAAALLAGNARLYERGVLHVGSASCWGFNQCICLVEVTS